MKAILLTVGVLAVLSTLALVYVDQSEKSNLERWHIHTPHWIHKVEHKIGHLHLKTELKKLGACASVVTSAVSNCGASISSDGSDISGDIGCVKAFASARSCARIF